MILIIIHNQNLNLKPKIMEQQLEEPGQQVGFDAYFLHAFKPLTIKQEEVFFKPEEIVDPVLRLDFRYSSLNGLIYERWNSGYL